MEKNYDGEILEYQIIEEPKEDYIRKNYWDIAIGLQQVDGLNPSEYMKTLVSKNINNEIKYEEVETLLKKYYDSQNKIEIDENEKECDLVSAKIVKLLENNNFELTIEYFKLIHKYLFSDIYKFNGEFRNLNISKKEPILNGETVIYTDYEMIEKSLEYDFSLESQKNYKEMNILDVINNIVDFTSRLWQVHPFMEGNTRTTAVFIIKYLRNIGFNVNNDMFKDNSIFFRNSLVRSNYFNKKLNIKQNNTYLIKFYENLILGKNNELKSKDLVIQELFEKVEK